MSELSGFIACAHSRRRFIIFVLGRSGRFGGPFLNKWRRAGCTACAYLAGATTPRLPFLSELPFAWMAKRTLTARARHAMYAHGSLFVDGFVYLVYVCVCICN